MKAGELFLLRLPTDSIANHGLGSLIPIPDMHVLTQLEIDRVETATYNYNAIILQLANQYDLAHVDTHGLLEKYQKTVSFTMVSSLRRHTLPATPSH